MEDLAEHLAAATVVGVESGADGGGDGLMQSATVDVDSSAEVRKAAAAAFEAGGSGKEDERQCSTARSGVNHDDTCDPQPRELPSGADTHSLLASNHQLPNGVLGASEHLDSSMTPISVRRRATALFPAGNWVPAVSPELPAVVETPTNELVALVYDASKDVTLIRGKLAREEVAGYLLADLLGIELLPGEALRLGESARKAALAFKGAESQLNNSASAKRSRLQKAAAKDAVRAARLETELQGLGTELEAARRKMSHAPLTLAGLPNGNTKVIEKRAPIKPTRAPVPVGPAHAPLCHRAHTYIEMAMSEAAGRTILAAYNVCHHKRRGQDPFYHEALEIAEVRYKHAMRQLKRAFPGEFCGWTESSALQMVDWTVRLEHAGHSVPAAVSAAALVGFNLRKRQWQ
jgi:hypothetical protein